MIMRGRSRVEALVLATVVVLGVATASCTASDARTSPTLTPLPSAASTTSASPSSVTPSASSSVPLAKAGPPPKTPFTKQGAEVFVRSYYLTANQALNTGRTAVLRRYTRAGCECRSQIALIDRVAKKREHFEGDGYKLQALTVAKPIGNAAVATVTFSLRSMPLVDQSGHRVDKLTDVKRQTDQLFLRYLQGRWFVERVFFGGPQ
ncbi:MAG: hypothetical protein ACJ74O_06630 [Frankiaceae bacterium]